MTETIYAPGGVDLPTVIVLSTGQISEGPWYAQRLELAL